MANNKFTPPKDVQEAAQKGLDLHEKNPDASTDSGMHTADILANGKEVDYEMIKKIHSYLARHSVDKGAEGWGDDDKPSNGYVSWLLWGGDAAQKWTEEVKKEQDDD